MELADLNASRVLVVDDDEDTRDLLRKRLVQAGFDVTEAVDGVDAIARMSADIPVILLDNMMPRATGLEVLDHVRKVFSNTEVIMLSAGGVESAVKAMSLGAFWYLQKPVHADELVALTRKATEVARLRESNDQLLDVVGDPLLFSDEDETFLFPPRIAAQLPKIASLDCSVLISGETGTGKNSLARCIHHQSARADGPFVAVSCAALPRDLLEAELFGYERGAFTGAIKTRPGRFELADTGTLFLDEIGELALELQPKLLMFLESRMVERLGGIGSKKVNLRLISATLQDLNRMCTERSFREDLYYRLKVLTIDLPPLRERRADLPALIRLLSRKIASRHNLEEVTFEREAVKKLLDYDWPGNIRELQHCLERGLVMSEDGVVPAEFIALGPSVRPSMFAGPLPLGGIPLWRLEQQAITQTLELCGGNKREAARRLGISEKSIYNKI